ncbi:MAG: N(4)-(beta-N-acetylglucosaminyl)-L-asparaginase [Chitinophagaceae bacterium]
MNRRQLLKNIALGSAFLSIPKRHFSNAQKQNKSIVLATWYNQAKAANEVAWGIIKSGGYALDAVEKGVMVSENDINNCCVGLGANPDREGVVTLDACIMNEKSECGSVAFLSQIKNPISVARKIMEKTPHIMLVGAGAQQFAIEQGFTLETDVLSDHAEANFKKWKEKSNYKPQINIEKGKGPFSDFRMESGEYNHDTIGMIAMDSFGNMSGACTTSGMAYKLHGRVGDSPIIGAGLYVDNEVGAATATGHGEEIIRVSGSFLVVEYMRQGYSPSIACKKAVERVKQKTNKHLSDIQVGFIAINVDGEYGAYSLQSGFDYAVSSSAQHHVKEISDSIL